MKLNKNYIKDILLFCRIKDNMILDFEHRNFIDTTSERSLQQEVVKFIEKDDYWLFTATLGDTLESDSSRVNAKKAGYTSGTPDLVIFNKNKQFSGILLELKNPNGFGVLSDKQKKFINKANDYTKNLCIVSNNLVSIVEILTKYKYDIKIENIDDF